MITFLTLTEKEKRGKFKKNNKTLPSDENLGDASIISFLVVHLSTYRETRFKWEPVSGAQREGLGWLSKDIFLRFYSWLQYGFYWVPSYAVVHCIMNTHCSLQLGCWELQHCVCCAEEGKSCFRLSFHIFMTPGQKHSSHPGNHSFLISFSDLGGHFFPHKRNYVLYSGDCWVYCKLVSKISSLKPGFAWVNSSLSLSCIND